MLTNRPFSVLVTLLPLLMLLGCDGGGDEGEGSAGESETVGEAGIDEDAVVAQAVDYANFEQISAPAPSAHGLADTVVVWVPPAFAAEYRAVDPDDADASAAFAPGTLFVKEHLDAEGTPAGMTIMYKGPEGYDPDNGDWWWAQADVDGTLNDAGAVGYCIACHSPREGADWVFGIPADEQL